MRQVPNYLIIGNGRVARHFRHYLSLLNIEFSVWHRAESPARLKKLAQTATHILILISDQAIEHFIDEHLQGTTAVKVHFSGALVSRKAFGAHPLMTFNTGLYTLEKYQSIPFVADDAGISLPGLPNKVHAIAPEMKAKYHALCVLSGNFSCLLWQKFFAAMTDEFHLPAETGQAYLRQQMENLLENSATAFTGPLARGDAETIRKNLAALDGDPFQRVYQSFVDIYPLLKEKSS